MIEGENGIGAYLAGSEQDTTVGELETGARTQSGKAFRGSGTDRNLLDLQCTQRCSGEVKLAGSGRTHQNLGQRDRTCRQRMPYCLQEYGTRLRMVPIAGVEVSDQNTRIDNNHSGHSSRSRSR